MTRKSVTDVPNEETQRLLAAVAESGLPALETLPVGEAREQFRARVAETTFSRVDVGQVSNTEIPVDDTTLPARVYLPPETTGPPDLLIYFHGGGFVIGDLDAYDEICRRICMAGSVAVVSVQYRKAPESKFPVAVEDALAATDYLVEHAAALGINNTTVFVAGDSAGGTLAAVVAQADAQKPAPGLTAQILIYPALDHVGSYGSRKEFSEIFPVTSAAMRWYDSCYFASPADKESPLASPGLSPDLGPVAPGLVITAGLDPLRDEGEAYGNRLCQISSHSRVRRFAGTVHGFLGMGRFLSCAYAAIEEIGDFVQIWRSSS